MGRLRLGLLTKFGILTILPIIASLGMIYLILFNVNTIVKGSFLREAKCVVECTAFISRHAILLDEKETLEHVIRTNQNNDDIAYLFVQDSTGKVLGGFVRDPELLKDDLIEMDSRRLKRFDQDIYHNFLGGHAILKRGKAIYEIIYNMRSLSSREDQLIDPNKGEVGLVRIGILRSKIEQIDKRVRLALVISSLGAIIFIGFVINFTVRTVILPLRKLSLSAEAIAKGKLDNYVGGIRTEDEIGKLADSFNRMLSSIKESEGILTQRLETEQMVTKISTDLINTDPSDIEQSYKRVLNMIGSFMKAECAWVYFLSPSGDFEWRHIWCSDELKDRLSEVEPAIEDILLRMQGEKESIEPICLSDISSPIGIGLKSDRFPIIKSLLSIPVFHNEILSGFIGLCAVEHGTMWHHEDVDIMKTIGNILVSTYKLKQTKRALEDRLEIERCLRTELEERTKELSIRNQELDSFVYNVSHDLKAPVISIQGFSSLLCKEYADQLGETGKLYIDRIQKNSERMVLLIDDLLELSRIGRVEGQPQATDIAEVVSDVIDELSEQIKSRGTRVTIKGKMPVITIDRTRVRQVFSNLISNANKFVGPDNKEPYIEIGYEDKGDHHQFYVRDNGIGIEKQYHEKIFYVFHRLNEIDVEGTGVGLAIVKKVVENFGGKVWVDSEKGKGTTMYFTIPKENSRRDKP